MVGALAGAGAGFMPRRRNRVLTFIRRDPVGAATGIVLLLVVAASLAASEVAPYLPNVISPDVLEGPSPQHLLGTDQLLFSCSCEFARPALIRTRVPLHHYLKFPISRPKETLTWF